MMSAEDDLGVMFAELAARPLVPSQSLMARILQDAADLQTPAARPVAASRPAQANGNWLAALAGIFGGGGALAGMSLAAATGLYLGVAQPAAVQTLALMVSGQKTIETLDLMPSADQLLAQE